MITMSTIITTLDTDITNMVDPDYDRIKRSVETDGIVLIKKQNTNPIHFSKIISKIWGIDNYRFLAWNTDGSSSKNAIAAFTQKQMPNPNAGDYWGHDDFRDNDDYPDPFNFPAHKTYPVQRVTGEKREGKWTGIFQLGKFCCLLYTSPSPRDVEESRMPSSA